MWSLKLDLPIWTSCSETSPSFCVLASRFHGDLKDQDVSDVLCVSQCLKVSLILQGLTSVVLLSSLGPSRASSAVPVLNNVCKSVCVCVRAPLQDACRSFPTPP